MTKLFMDQNYIWYKGLMHCIRWLGAQSLLVFSLNTSIIAIALLQYRDIRIGRVYPRASLLSWHELGCIVCMFTNHG